MNVRGRVGVPGYGLKSIEMKGHSKLVSTTFVGGLKHQPIRYKLC
jgi:hypothetical protein